MKRIILKVFSLLFILTFHSANVTADTQGNTPGWKAGVARAIITPEQPMWMAGYASRDHPAEKKLHDLWAKALVLEDENGYHAVLITTDLIGFKKYMSDRIRDRLKVKYGLSRAQVILSSSHTHTGPALKNSAIEDLPRISDFPTEMEWNTVTGGIFSQLQQDRIKQYSDKTEDQIVSLVGKALDSMEHVQLLSGYGVARFAINRRNLRTKTTLDQMTLMDGPVDHSVPVMKVVTRSGKILAIVFGYAAHATTLGFYQWSGDYPGFAQIALEKSFPGTTAMFFAGCGADQSPFPVGTVARAVQYGNTLACAVEQVLSEPMQELDAKLITIYSEVDIQYTSPFTREELEKTVRGSSGWQKVSASCSLARLDREKSLPASYPSYPVQVWRIGEQNLVVLGSEVVVDYTIRLKQIFGQDLFVMAYANEMMGYIPSARILREGGYEASGRWKPDIEMAILQEVMRLAAQAGVPQPGDINKIYRRDY